MRKPACPHAETLDRRAPESREGRLRHITMIPAWARLADPENRPAPHLRRRKGKACQRRKIAVGRFGNLMQATDAHAEGKSRLNGKRRRERAHDAFRLEGRDIHMFLFCSFEAESRLTPKKSIES